MWCVDPFLVWSDLDYWTKVCSAILDETSELQGDKYVPVSSVPSYSTRFTVECISIDCFGKWTGFGFLRHRILFCDQWMANCWHDHGDLWVHRALQVYFTLFTNPVFHPSFTGWIFLSLTSSELWPAMVTFLRKFPMLSWMLHQSYVPAVRVFRISCAIHSGLYISNYMITYILKKWIG